MHYKTIALELVKEHRKLHNHLRKKRRLLQAVEHYANYLKTNHDAWTTRLEATRPESSPSQIASEALELAVTDLDNCLRLLSLLSASNAPLSLKEAIAFIRGSARRG